MSHKQLSDDELDALVVRSLSRLPSYAPRHGFGDRVMMRVRLPEPVPVALYRRARTWAGAPRRAMALAVSYAALAVVSLGIAVPWLVSHGSGIAFWTDRALGKGLEGVHATAAAFAGWVVGSGLARSALSARVTSPSVLAAAAGLSVAYAGSALLLRALLRAPGGGHAPLPTRR